MAQARSAPRADFASSGSPSQSQTSGRSPPIVTSRSRRRFFSRRYSLSVIGSGTCPKMYSASSNTLLLQRVIVASQPEIKPSCSMLARRMKTYGPRSPLTPLRPHLPVLLSAVRKSSQPQIIDMVDNFRRVQTFT